MNYIILYSFVKILIFTKILNIKIRDCEKRIVP